MHEYEYDDKLTAEDHARLDEKARERREEENRRIADIQDVIWAIFCEAPQAVLSREALEDKVFERMGVTDWREKAYLAESLLRKAIFDLLLRGIIDDVNGYHWMLWGKG